MISNEEISRRRTFLLVFEEFLLDFKSELVLLRISVKSLWLFQRDSRLKTRDSLEEVVVWVTGRRRWSGDGGSPCSFDFLLDGLLELAGGELRWHLILMIVVHAYLFFLIFDVSCSVHQLVCAVKAATAWRRVTVVDLTFLGELVRGCFVRREDSGRELRWFREACLAMPMTSAYWWDIPRTLLIDSVDETFVLLVYVVGTVVVAKGVLGEILWSGCPALLRWTSRTASAFHFLLLASAEISLGVVTQLGGGTYFSPTDFERGREDDRRREEEL